MNQSGMRISVMTPQNTAVSRSGHAIPDSLAAPLSLRKNFSWTFAGNVVYAASQWGILVVMAKLGTPEMVGQFALGLAVTAPVIMFANLQLRAVQATDARREYQFADYLGLRLITTLLAYLVIVGITLISGYGPDTTLVILFIGLAKSFEALSDVFFGLLQQRERMDRIAKSLMIEGPVTLAVMGIILYVTRSVVWATAGMAAVWGLQLFLYDRRSGFLILRLWSPDGIAWRLLRPRFRAATLARLVWLALPLGFAGALGSLNVNIPRYFLERFLGESQLGIFAAIAYIMMMGNYLINALGQAANPRLASHYRIGNQSAFRRLLKQLVILGAFIGLAGIILAVVGGGSLLNIFYGDEYAKENDVLVIMMIAAAVQYTYIFFASALQAMWHFRVQAYIQVLSTVLSISLSIFLIPQNGIRGGALVILMRTVVEGLIYILIHFVNQISPSMKDKKRSNVYDIESI